MNLYYHLGKTNQTTKAIKARKGLAIVTEEKAWMNEFLMLIWFDQIDKKQRELDFNRSLIVHNAFEAHTTDEKKAVLSGNKKRAKT